MGQIVDGFIIDIRRKIGAICSDDRGFRGSDNRFRLCLDPERSVNCGLHGPTSTVTLATL